MTTKRATTLTFCQPAPVSAPLDPIPRILPYGGVSLIAGAAGTGKTALLASFLRDLRQGRPIFGHQPSPIPAVAVITCDRGWDRGAGFWFERAGFAEIPHYAMVDDPLFDPRSLRRKFDRTARLLEMVDKLALPSRSLVAVDPIGLFLGGNLNDYDSCAVACLELRAGLRNRGLTLVGTAHSGKMKTDKNQRYLRLQDAILGSAALFGFGDTQMYLAAPDELRKSHYTLLWHPHEAKAEVFDLMRDENGLFVPYVPSDTGSGVRVLALLPEDGAPLTLAEIVQLAAAIPLTPKTVQRALLELIEQGLVVKVKHGTYRRVEKAKGGAPGKEGV
jgi:DNA-binding transcriptional ArsR family regulator